MEVKSVERGVTNWSLKFIELLRAPLTVAEILDPAIRYTRFDLSPSKLFSLGHATFILSMFGDESRTHFRKLL